MAGPFSTYYKLRMANPQIQLPGEAPLVPIGGEQPQQTIQPQQSQQPQVDTSDPINSLAGMLVTPAEKEAQQQKMLQNKRRMIAWTGLFDGMRNLANLWGVSKGATSQRYTDNPYQTIESSFSQEQQRQDALNQNRDRYANTLYNLQRQADQDKMRKEAHQAQLKWYDTRDEMARQKQDLAEFKAQTDADYKKATLEQKNAINEVRMRLLEGQINKTEAERQYRLIMTGKAQGGTGKSGSAGDIETETIQWTDDQGNKHKKVIKKGTPSGRSGSLLPGAKGNSTTTVGSLLPK